MTEGGRSTEPPPPASFEVASLELRADPFQGSEPCPVKITFTGRISAVGGSGDVAYRFIRSDGASGPVQNLHFDNAGSQEVFDDWTLGTSGTTVTGWVAIRVLTPQPQDSSPADFSIQCQ